MSHKVDIIKMHKSSTSVSVTRQRAIVTSGGSIRMSGNSKELVEMVAIFLFFYIQLLPVLCSTCPYHGDWHANNTYKMVSIDCAKHCMCD